VSILLQASEELVAALAASIQNAQQQPPGVPIQEGLMAKKAQFSLDYSTDLWLGDLALTRKSDETRRKYRYLLEQFAEMFEHLTPAEVQEEHCRRFLARWADSSPSTLALHVSILRGFFKFLKAQKIIGAVSPMENIERPRRHRPEDLDVVSVTAREVRLMFAAVQSWQELICMGALCYAGVRRRAASKARRRDCDLDAGTIRYREKGGKVIVKPVAADFLAILHGADQAGVWNTPDDYLIPNRVPTTVRRNGERGHKVIYETVKKVAARAGVEATPHALRAAFAVQFDETHPGQVIALKELLGHSRIETTMVYLRRKDKQAAMETVRNLSWGDFALPASPVIPPAGFEPALPANVDATKGRAATDTGRVPASLQAKLDQLSSAGKRGRTRQ
jgi:integrase